MRVARDQADEQAAQGVRVARDQADEQAAQTKASIEAAQKEALKDTQPPLHCDLPVQVPFPERQFFSLSFCNAVWWIYIVGGRSRS